MLLLFLLFSQNKRRHVRALTWGSSASQTRIMAHIYIRFDFGTDEEKAQQARHKLDGWKQAFRPDKRLLYKLDRPESATVEASAKPEAAEQPAPANGKVGLLIRLYFSSYEKLSEQRWLDRIPSEDPFKGASPKIIHQSDPEFESTDKQFESLV